MSFYDKYLKYNNGAGELPDNAFRISASQFSQFMEHPSKWYREKVLNEEGFKGNTASLIGTIVHGCAAAKANGEEPSLEDINRYIQEHSNIVEFPDVDPTIVSNSWKEMAMVLVNTYVNQQTYLEVEPFMSYELAPGYFPSGSIDAILGTKESAKIIDYKTYNSKTKPRAIPMYYKYQLLIYSYICRKQGINVDRVELVYINRYIDGGISEKTGKPLKSYAPEVTVLTEHVTDDDMAFIESVLKLCIETHQLVVKHPELAYIAYRDYRLREL